MEIERKYLVRELPEDLSQYPYAEIEQVYLMDTPVIRIRKTGEKYVLTVKGAGLLSREELNLPLTEEAYARLYEKKEGVPVTKRRYKIPYEGLTIELDLFKGAQDGLVLAEVEFDSVEASEAFAPPAWFGEEVTYDPRYQNVSMAYQSRED